MNTLKTVILCTLSAILLFSCKKDEIHGTGQTGSQERSLGAFENVTIQGPVKVNVRYGSEQHVTVRTDVVALNKVETRVSNNTLVIDLDESHNYQHISFEVEVEMPGISTLSHEGVGNWSLSGFQDLQELHIVHNGVGDLRLSGSASQLNINKDGVGRIQAFAFTADSCYVGHSGVGDMELMVTDHLSGYLSGVGNIYYRGQPSMSISDTGVGNIIHVD